MQQCHLKWKKDPAVCGKTRGDQGEKPTQVQTPGDGRVKSGDRRFGGADSL